MAPYTPTSWVNDQAPALNATNLNHLTNELIAQAAAVSPPISQTLPTWVNGAVPAISDPVPLNEMERVIEAVAQSLGLSYTKTTWSNLWSPARNAARFNNMEQQAQANRVAIDTPPPPPVSTLYGVVMNGTGLGNLQVGGVDSGGNPLQRQVMHRFRAEHSGQLASIRWYCKIQDTSYSNGNHGTIVVDLYNADGAGLPTGSSLGRTAQLVHPATSVWPLQTWPSPPTVTNGNLYVLVWTNLELDTGANFCSVNDVDLVPTPTPRQPYAPNTDVEVRYRDNNGSWSTTSTGRTTIHQLTWVDGYIQGNGYIDYRPSIMQNIGGSVQIRETFTPSAPRTLTNVFVYLRKSGTPSALSISLKKAGVTQATASIAAGSIPTSYGWVSTALSVPVALTAGSAYSLELSATTGTYNVVPMQDGISHGFSGGLIFEEGQYETSANGGSAWSALTDHDIPVYFS